LAGTSSSGDVSDGAVGRAVGTRDIEESARGVDARKIPSFSKAGAVFVPLIGVFDLSLLGSSSSEESSGVAAPLPGSLDTHSSSSSPGLEIVKPVFCLASECLEVEACARFCSFKAAWIPLFTLGKGKVVFG
jgi:hypothetical protein